VAWLCSVPREGEAGGDGPPFTLYFLLIKKSFIFELLLLLLLSLECCWREEEDVLRVWDVSVTT
jgi:hypothetical protein